MVDASPLTTATGVSTTVPFSVWLTYSTKYSSVLDATTMGTAVTSTGVGTASKLGEHWLVEVSVSSLSAMVMVCFTPITAPSSIAVISMLSSASTTASSTAVTVAFAEVSPAASVSVLAVTV